MELVRFEFTGRSHCSSGASHVLRAGSAVFMLHVQASDASGRSDAWMHRHLPQESHATHVCSITFMLRETWREVLR